MAKRDKRTNNGNRPSPVAKKELKIIPKNKKQQEYLNKIYDSTITVGLGSAGSGKTYLPTLVAMKLLIEKKINRIVICRPAITAEGEELGFLPGNIIAKMEPFIQPIFEALRTYYTNTEINQMLFNNTIEIIPLAYMRGRSITDAFIIADEFQNATMNQMFMLLTRIGENSKMVITGDPLQKDRAGNTLQDTINRMRHIHGFSFVVFRPENVVRHPIINEILDAFSYTEQQYNIIEEKPKTNGHAKKPNGESNYSGFNNPPEDKILAIAH